MEAVLGESLTASESPLDLRPHPGAALDVWLSCGSGFDFPCRFVEVQRVGGGVNNNPLFQFFWQLGSVFSKGSRASR